LLSFPSSSLSLSLSLEEDEDEDEEEAAAGVVRDAAAPFFLPAGVAGAATAFFPFLSPSLSLSLSLSLDDDEEEESEPTAALAAVDPPTALIYKASKSCFPGVRDKAPFPLPSFNSAAAVLSKPWACVCKEGGSEGGWVSGIGKVSLRLLMARLLTGTQPESQHTQYHTSRLECVRTLRKARMSPSS
jgi:hypothetical protein